MRHLHAMSVLLLFVAACGPKTADPTTPVLTGGGDPGRAGGAASTTKLDHEAAALEGAIYLPDALASLPMPGGDKVIKRSIPDQKKRFDKAKGATRVVEGEHFARLLWFGGGEKEHRELAVIVLREIAPLGKGEERLVHMFAIAAHSTGQDEFAQAAWQDLATRFPESDHGGRYRAMLELAKLRAGAPATRLDDTNWEAAYVNAWIAFTAGNDTIAVAALTSAAAAWPHVETLPALRRDIMLIFARAGGSALDAMKVLEALDKKDGGPALPVLHGLAQAYYFAGEDGHALTVLEVVVGSADAALKPEALRMQAQVAFNMDDAALATRAAHSAWAAVAAGGGSVTRERTAAVADTILQLGAHYTYAFALTKDRALGEAGYKLLTLYVAIPERTDTARVKEMQTELAKILDGTNKPQSGVTLSKQVVRGAVAKHYEGVIACYERQLAKQRDLAGTLTLAFSVTAAGKITGFDAKSDVTGLTAVGACVAKLAPSWTIPVGSITDVTMPIRFSPLKP